MTRRISHIFLALALVGLLFVPAISSAQSTGGKVGVVDMNRVINETADGQAAKKRLERDMTRRQRELDSKQKDFEKFAEDLQSSFDMLTDDAKAKRMQEYQQKATELQQLYGEHQQQLAEAEAQATSKIIERVIKIVEDVAKKGKYSLVVDAGAVLYAASGNDLTKEIIDLYNKAH